mmetsp:Transcript_18559/g.25821  ORF Transcript_18559/g.25821 Transcript_18559/m.25821 type:complete len:107 (+) Transcript_18559:1462-1782(+)
MEMAVVLDLIHSVHLEEINGVINGGASPIVVLVVLVDITTDAIAVSTKGVHGNSSSNAKRMPPRTSRLVILIPTLDARRNSRTRNPAEAPPFSEAILQICLQMFPS